MLQRSQSMKFQEFGWASQVEELFVGIKLIAMLWQSQCMKFHEFDRASPLQLKGLYDPVMKLLCNEAKLPTHTHTNVMKDCLS